MIRIVLAYSGEATDVEAVRTYQRMKLGRAGGETRLSPLFPLPAKSLDDWRYPAWSGNAGLSDRKAYRKLYESNRVARLAESVRVAAPTTVTFLGTSYLNYWNQIAGMDLQAIGDVAFAGITEKTRFIACKHPAVKGITSEYFVRVGRAHRAA